MVKNKVTKLFSNTAIFTVGKFVSKLIVIFMLPFYTACLSSAEYSTADLITNLCNLIIPLAGLGVSEGIFRYAAQSGEDKESFFTNGVIIMLGGSVLFLALSPLISLADYFAPYFALIITYVLASNIHAVCSQYVCAIGKTKLFAGQGILNTCLTVLLNIIFLAVFDMGIDGYVLSVILADGLTAIFLVFVARLYSSFKPKKINGSTVRSMLKFCLPLVPSTICWWITSVSDRYMVAYFCSDSINGLYTAAYKIPTLLTYVVTIFNDAWKLSVASDDDGVEERTKFYSNVFKYYIAVMFMGGTALAVTARISSAILFDASYGDAWVYIPILSLATVFTSLDTFMGSAYFTVKKTTMSFWTSLIGAVLNIGLNLLMIPDFGLGWGAMGASIATFISYFVVFIIRAVTMRRFIPFKLYPLRLTLNTFMLSMAVIVTSLWGTNVYGILISIAILMVCLVYNGNDIIKSCKTVILSLKKRKA